MVKEEKETNDSNVNKNTMLAIEWGQQESSTLENFILVESRKKRKHTRKRR